MSKLILQARVSSLANDGYERGLLSIQPMLDGFGLEISATEPFDARSKRKLNHDLT